MDARQQTLVETLRDESMALFEANQTARAAAERTLPLMLTIVGAAVATGVNVHSDSVAIALPPLVLLLLSYMFQQYAVVSITGVARAALEERINRELEVSAGLIYESVVSSIRQRGPLSLSVRAFQILVGLMLAVVVGVGIDVALSSHHA